MRAISRSEAAPLHISSCRISECACSRDCSPASTSSLALGRWGVIGSGASGVQITEALAWAGCDVTQFIRRAQWVHIRDNPHSSWRQRLKLRLPFGYRREQRRLWQFINESDRWRLESGPQLEAMEHEFRSYLDCIKDRRRQPEILDEPSCLIRQTTSTGGESLCSPLRQRAGEPQTRRAGSQPS